ncbi:MAG: DUF3365 domain-containing protein [Pseudomonadota bacterium]
MRRNHAIAFTAFALAACGPAADQATDKAAGPAPTAHAVDPADIEAARAATGMLGARLKTRLVETMSAAGPVAAIDVCNLEAPEIASAVSAENGMSVGRTALKLRNPANAPDAFERAVLARFIEEIAAGADPAALDHAEIVETEGGPALRYMKPIMTGAPCTVCHGTDISAEVKTAIDARYPEDAATGFALGEMRGAFTVSKRPGE